jgi:peptidoglycan/LPS O-acetylase OafA/YrhL
MPRLTPKRWLQDRLLLIGAAIVFIAVWVGAFSAADHYHVSSLAVFMAFGCILFVATVGWDYRKGFKSPAFTVFFAVWLAVNLTLFYFAAAYLSWLYWAALVPAILGAGYVFAARVLNIRPEPKGWWLNKR